MAQTISRFCPHCEQNREFVRSASTTMELGTKTKWRCQECNFKIVNLSAIEGEITA